MSKRNRIMNYTINSKGKSNSKKQMISYESKSIAVSTSI